MWSGTFIFSLVVICDVLLKLCHWDRYLLVGIEGALQER